MLFAQVLVNPAMVPAAVGAVVSATVSELGVPLPHAFVGVT